MKTFPTMDFAGKKFDVLLCIGVLAIFAFIINTWFACAADDKWSLAFFVQGLVLFFVAFGCFAARFVPD